MPTVVFLNDHAFTGEDVRTKALGGIETATILLAEELAALGYSVTVYNGNNGESIDKGVKYRPKAAMHHENADIAIASSNTSFLTRLNVKLPIVWQHNRQSFSKMWKRGEVFALLRVRPVLITLSNDAFQQTPKYIPYRSRHIIPHAIETEFLEDNTISFAEREQAAFFASRPSRNLDWVIDVWKQYIFPALPKAKLYICIPPTATFKFDIDELAAHNIIYKGSIPKKDLRDLINRCRLLLYPGHINETGCQVALQAIGLGIPIVTCGLGSLKDLVSSDRTGYIETDKKRYGKKAVECLTNSNCWIQLHRNTLKHDWRKSYRERAHDWNKLIIDQLNINKE